MNIYMWTLLIVASFMSVAFMISLQNIKQNKNYRYFRYYSYLLVIWSVISILRNVIEEPFLIYHLAFLIYPIVFLVTSFLYMTIKVYTGGTVNKYIKIFVAVFFVIDLGLSLTNSFHHLMLDLNYTSLIISRDFGQAGLGIFFYIHTLVCYTLMFVSLYELLKFFIIRIKRDKDIYPFILFSASIILGIILNIIHVFFTPFEVDPTFVFMVVVGVIMMDIFRKRDLKLLLNANENRDILDNIRELYIISDHLGMVVDCSKNLKNKYQELIDQGITLKDLKNKMKEKTVLYYSDKELNREFDPKKRYYHIKEQKVRMPRFKYFGRITLLYDETSDLKLINEMDRAMSHDLMTGLYNRNHFENQIPLLESSNNNFGVIIMDVDGLKLHNDYFGHKNGDELLIKFSNMLLNISNENSDLIPIRLGGDEFLLISKIGNKETLKEISEGLQELGKSDDPKKCICFSYGISVRTNKLDKFSQVLKDADKNLYIMKEKKIEKKIEMEAYFNSLDKSIIN